MKPAIEACPFCGEGCRQHTTVAHIEKQKGYRVECHWCYARGPLFGTELEAIAEWNKVTLLINSQGRGLMDAAHRVAIAEQKNLTKRRQHKTKTQNKVSKTYGK